MNIRIKSTDLSMTDEMNEHVRRILSKIEQALGGDPSIQCDIELARTTQHHQKGDVFRAEIHITGGGMDEYASAEREDLRSSVTEVRDELMRKLRGEKEKRISYFRRSGARVKAIMKGMLPWGEKGWYRRGR